MTKVQFSTRKLGSNIFTLMQIPKEVTQSTDHLSKYISMLGALHSEFSR